MVMSSMYCYVRDHYSYFETKDNGRINDITLRGCYMIPVFLTNMVHTAADIHEQRIALLTK